MPGRPGEEDDLAGGLHDPQRQQRAPQGTVSLGWARRAPRNADSGCLVHWLALHASQLDGIKVGGHQASSTSLATIMTVLYYRILQPHDRVAVKVGASARALHIHQRWRAN